MELRSTKNQKLLNIHKWGETLQTLIKQPNTYKWGYTLQTPIKLPSTYKWGETLRTPIREPNIHNGGDTSNPNIPILMTQQKLPTSQEGRHFKPPHLETDNPVEALNKSTQ